jgi:hypothetical protein
MSRVNTYNAIVWSTQHPHATYGLKRAARKVNVWRAEMHAGSLVLSFLQRALCAWVHTRTCLYTVPQIQDAALLVTAVFQQDWAPLHLTHFFIQDSIYDHLHTSPVDDGWVTNLKVDGRKRPWPNLKHYPRICMEGPRKKKKTQTGQPVSRPKYEHGTSQIQRSVNHSAETFGAFCCWITNLLRN